MIQSGILGRANEVECVDSCHRIEGLLKGKFLLCETRGVRIGISRGVGRPFRSCQRLDGKVEIRQRTCVYLVYHGHGQVYWIVGTTGTAYQPLAKYLSAFLSRLRQNEFSLKDSFDAVTRIHKFHLTCSPKDTALYHSMLSPYLRTFL